MKRIDRVPAKFRKQVEGRLRRLSAVIRARREALGLTQERLAENLDISIETLKAVEQGRRIPSLAMLLYICLFLNVELKPEIR